MSDTELCSYLNGEKSAFDIDARLDSVLVSNVYDTATFRYPLSGIWPGIIIADIFFYSYKFFHVIVSLERDDWFFLLFFPLLLRNKFRIEA